MGVRLGAGFPQFPYVVGHSQHPVLVEHSLNALDEILEFVILNAVVILAG